MARLFTSGFETQLLSTLPTYHGEANASGITCTSVGTPTVDTSVQRSGAACMNGATGGANYMNIISPVTVLDRHYYFRGYFRFADATPSSALTFCTQLGATLTIVVFRLSTAGRIQVLDANSVQVGSDSATLSDNTWHRLEYHLVIPTASTGTVEAKLDGTTFVSSSAVDVNNSVASTTNIRVGHVQTGTITNVYVDDLAVNDDQGSDQNSWVGEGKVILLKPTADSAIGSGWEAPQTSGSDTTDIYTAVDTTPPVGVLSGAPHSDVDANNQAYIFNAAANTNSYDATLETYTAGGIGASDTITLVQPLVRASVNSTTGTNTLGITGVSNPAIAEVTGFNLELTAVAAAEPVGWKSFRGTVTYAPSVTKGTGPVVRAHKINSSTNANMVDLMGLYVEYVVVSAAAPIPDVITAPIDQA